MKYSFWAGPIETAEMSLGRNKRITVSVAQAFKSSALWLPVSLLLRPILHAFRLITRVEAVADGTNSVVYVSIVLVNECTLKEL